jgi:hypothetical protein
MPFKKIAWATLLLVSYLSKLQAQQNIGIGTTTPQSILHVKGTGVGTQIILEENAGSMLRISNEANSAGAFIGTSSNHRFSIVSNNEVRMVVAANGNVGVGTINPQQMLSVFKGLNLDQENANRTTFDNGLRFGSNSTEGIASNRGNDHNNYPLKNLLFFTNNNLSMLINRDGHVSIGDIIPTGRLTIKHESRYNLPEYSGKSTIAIRGAGTGTIQYLISGSDNQNQVSFITAEKIAPYVNVGSVLMLQRIGNLSVGPILNPTHKLEVDGDVRFTGDLKVRGNKGIVQNIDGTQLVRITKQITLENETFTSNQTKFIDFLWPVPFSGTPDCYVGNIVGGSGGWAECVLSVALVNANGGRLYIFNPRTISFTPNFTVNILAFGPRNP